jgi:hypothetical protein
MTTSSAPQNSDGPYPTHGLSEGNSCRSDSLPNPSRQETDGQTNRNEDTQEHATNTKNPRPTGSTRTVRTYQADCPPGADRRENSSPRANPRAPYHLSFQGSPKQLKLLRKGLGKMWSIPMGCYAPKLVSSNEINHQESNRHRTPPKT